MLELTSEDIEHLLSLSESEQEEFWSNLDPESIQLVIEQVQSYVPDSTSQRRLTGNYASEQSAKVAEIQNAKTAAGQEIGPLREPADINRRERCSRDNLLFAETYFASTFYLSWAPYQREMMDRFQEVLINGGKECHAVRRGGLKSTCARVSTLWAAVNGHRRFPVLVGATDDKASEHRENLFRMMASSQLLLDDYPELLPLILKYKQPKKSYRLNGRLLTVHAKDAKDRIVFPDIWDAPSCECHIAPYSVQSTDVSGLAYVDRFGVTIRPDAIIYDDVQTPQSADSPSMTDQREERITKTFGGLKGLGQDMAEIMVCTVRKHRDLTERFLDRKRHPDWYGKAHKSVIQMPDRMDLWEQYKTKLAQGETPAEGKQIAQKFYEQNRSAMDAGGIVAWELDKEEDQISALQSLMTVWAVDPEFFRCEIQQEGAVPVNTTGVRLDSAALLTRLSQVDRGELPDKSNHVVAYIDSSDQVLWWMVSAFAADFSGAVIDYGTWPDQQRPVFYKSDLARRIEQIASGLSWEESFVLAHNQLEQFLFHQWPMIELLGKDWSDGQQMPLIRGQIASSPHRQKIRPCKGFNVNPGRKPIHLWGDQHRDKSGTGWIERRTETPVHVQYDSNAIKNMAARRLITVPGAPSSVMLPGKSETENRLLVEHLTSEEPHEWARDGQTAIRWEKLPGRDNDWLDTFCGCITMASVVGVKLSGDVPAKKQLRTFQLPGGVRGR